MKTKQHVKHAVAALALGLCITPALAQGHSDVGVRGYSYPSVPQWDYSLVSDVPRTTKNAQYRDMTIDFASLPFSEAVVRVKGDGSRRVALLVDPTCPHSKAMEANLEQVDNVTVYTFIASILNGSEAVVSAIQCSENKGAVYDSYSKNGVLPPVAMCSSRTSEKIKRAFHGFKGMDVVTPSIIFESNVFVSSVLSVGELNALITQSEINRL